MAAMFDFLLLLAQQVQNHSFNQKFIEGQNHF